MMKVQGGNFIFYILWQVWVLGNIFNYFGELDLNV